MESRHHTVLGSSGAILDCHHTVLDLAKPSLLIALPFGVPAAVAGAAFERFAPRFNVVTWESRYILNTDQEFTGEERLAPAEHVGDMVRILESLELDSCHLIGYCSGAGISLAAAQMYPDRFTGLVLVNGEYQLFRKGHTATDYQRSIDTFLSITAASRQQAGVMFERMAEISKAGEPVSRSELDRQINLPFSRAEYLYRYAKNYMAYRDFDALELAAQIQQDTFVVTGRKDIHSDMENSMAICDALSSARRFIADEGDHYDFCRAGSSTLEEVDAHLSSCWAGAAHAPPISGRPHAVTGGVGEESTSQEVADG